MLIFIDDRRSSQVCACFFSYFSLFFVRVVFFVLFYFFSWGTIPTPRVMVGAFFPCGDASDWDLFGDELMRRGGSLVIAYPMFEVIRF